MNGLNSISLLIIFFVSITKNTMVAQTRSIDSLMSQLKILNKSAATFSNDTSKIKTLNILAAHLNAENPDTALIVSEQALQLATQTQWKLGIAICAHQIGLFRWAKGDYTIALDHYQKALFIYNELSALPDNQLHIQARKYKIKTLGNIGLVYSEQGDYPKALNYHFQALQLAEEVNDKHSVAINLGNIGIVYEMENVFPQALNYYTRALRVDMERNDKYSTGIDLGNIGNIYYYMDELDKALDYYFKALTIATELGDKSGMARCYGNLGNVYYDKKNYTTSLDYYFRSLKIKEEMGDKHRVAVWLGNIGSLYLQIGKFGDAENYLKKSLALSDSIGVLEQVQFAHQKLSQLYDTTGKISLAFLHYKKCIAVRDTIDSEENQKKQVRTEMNYEFEKKQLANKAAQDKKDAIANEEKEKQAIILYGVATGLIMVIVFSFFLYRRFKITQKQKQIIEKQKEAVTMQKEIIEQQKRIVEEHQKEILDSLHYAKRIQTALLPNTKYISKNMNRLKN